MYNKNKQIVDLSSKEPQELTASVGFFEGDKVGFEVGDTVGLDVDMPSSSQAIVQ